MNAAAFPTDAEARLVDRLRDAGALRVSLVAERAGRVIGHVACSPVRIVAVGGAEHGAIGLAPMAVAPALQRTGVGGALVRAGLDACLAIGEPVVFVLGHPAYYPRFGFEPAAPRGLRYAGGASFDPAFFVRELASHASVGLTGTVHYHPAFASL